MTTDLEEALRDALVARATIVRPDPTAYVALVAYRSRRRLNRRYELVAAALTLVAIAGGVAVVRHDPKGATTIPATGVPAHVLAVVKEKLGLYDATDLAHPIDTWAPSGLLAGPVAAAGDGHTYIGTAIAPDTCKTTLARFDVSAGTLRPAEVPGGEIDGAVTVLAVTRDARKLAYVIDSGPQCDVQELHVRDLRTGHERVWTTTEAGGFTLEYPSWSPDGRYLAHSDEPGLRVLDTKAKGTTYVGEPIQSVTHDGLSCRPGSVQYLAGGELTAYLDCASDQFDAAGAAKDAVVVVDPRTGREVRTLFALPNKPDTALRDITIAGSGDAALIALSDGDGNHPRVVRWDAARGVRPVDTAGRELQAVAW